MRQRIRDALEARAEEAPENAHLQRQLVLIHNAQITTIHSFCLQVLRSHFHMIGLDPGFRIADEGEMLLLRQDVLKETLEEAYELGVMDVISKPVVPYMVQRRVDSVVELFQARKRLNSVVEKQRSEILEQSRRILELSLGMIEALSTAIEFRSGESGEHVRRIHDITKFMLEKTKLGRGLSQEEISHIALASIMHDVGKIAIPDEERKAIGLHENAEDKRIEWDVEKEKPLAVEFSGDEMEYLRKACERISDEELPDDMWATVSRIYDFIQEK